MLLREVEASRTRYIKLGPAGAWVDLCLGEGSLRIGHRQVPHSVAHTRDRAAIHKHLVDQGVTPRRATEKSREIMDFYDDDDATIWITFANGFLWWCRAATEVVDLGLENEHGTKMRRCSIPWSNRSVGGVALRISELNGKLTRTAAYRQTICAVSASDYLLAKLNDEILPEVSEALTARDGLQGTLSN